MPLRVKIRRSVNISTTVLTIDRKLKSNLVSSDTMAVQTPADATVSIVGTRRNQTFEGVAGNLLTPLNRWRRFPRRLVDFERDGKEYFQVGPRSGKHDISQLPSLTWTKDDEFVVDFGIHMVGYLSFTLNSIGNNMDAPCRLHITFGESVFDVTMDMNNVKTWLSTSWLPDEIVNVDACPMSVSLSRRYAFRYLRIRIVDVSPKYMVSFADIECDCVSAVSPDQYVDRYEFSDGLLETIDQVSMSTLRDCMQMVFEDGPRRDRRLWIGDLRLQALTNYTTFRNLDLVKRCLYLFAAVAREDGSLPACVFLQPRLSPSTDYIVDYDALFAPTVLDYVTASGDLASGHELWDTVLGCLKRASVHVDPDTNTFDPGRTADWKFLDWDNKLDRTAGEHGVLLYSLKAANKLAQLLHKPEPFHGLVERLTAGASCFLSDDDVFVSGPDRQISHASASWLVLAEAFPLETARRALLNTLAHPDSIKPLTPYLWHHVCDALATVECYKECVSLIVSYWGAMAKAGADTFWECFDASDPMASPYGDVRNNSFCHAWSCTPSYLLRGKLKQYVGATFAGQVTMAELDGQWVKKSIV